MADPISVAAGIVGLTGFAIECSKILYSTIDNIKGYGKSVRELGEETKALSEVLGSLQEMCSAPGVDFSSLQAPVARCGQLCQECSTLVMKCTARTDNGKFSVRDFLTLTYKGKNITELRSLMSAYKSTITIAIADVNLRQVTVTSNLLQEYKRTIDDTQSHLDELLQRYAESPNDSFSTGGQEVVGAHEDYGSLEIEERTSIEECLRICTRVSEHIEQAQEESVVSLSKPQRHRPDLVGLSGIQARQITSHRLQNCKVEIGLTSRELRLRLQEIDSRLAKLSIAAPSGDGRSANTDVADDAKEELESIRQCLSVCQDATEKVASERINIFEDVKSGVRAKQVVVSTIGELVSAKRVISGDDSVQLLGQMSDASIQHYARSESSASSASAGITTKNVSESRDVSV